MSNLVVNQCEYGCGIVGHWDVGKQEQVGEELEEHYKKCKNKKIWDKIHELTILYETAREEGNDEAHDKVTWDLFDLFLKKDLDRTDSPNYLTFENECCKREAENCGDIQLEGFAEYPNSFRVHCRKCWNKTSEKRGLAK